jgi:radical SAM superfamily enzyme YgiQ (UPF0313 family)
MQWRRIEKARRILAAEAGTVRKDWGGRLPVALVYANTYRVGMGSLALHTLYRLFNDREDVVCERVFWEGRGQAGEAPISLESQRPLGDFAALAFSLSFELDYLNAVQMLKDARLPLLAQERDASHPLLVAGGPAIYANPEPLALIFDAFAIGEGEVIIPPLTDALWEAWRSAPHTALSALAAVPGMYVPALDNGPVRRQWLRDLDAHPATTQIYAAGVEFGDRVLIEVARGCGRGCRFCLAGYGYRPPRELRPATVLQAIRPGLQHRDKVGLVGAAISDYSCIDELATELRRMGVRLSVSSLRADSISEPLLRALAESNTQTLTIAPEAGSWRLRRAINKPQADEQIMAAVELAARYNFPQLKLYFMVGQPGEEMEDVEAIVKAALEARRVFSRSMVVNATPYVPKAHTAFQWAAMAPPELLEERIRYLERQLAPQRIKVRYDSPAWAAVEGILARGDRRLGHALARVKRASLAGWRRALREAGLDQGEYLRQREPDEPLPWATVDMGVESSYLRREWQKAQQGDLTPPCPPDGCSACGVCEPNPGKET